MDDDDVFLFDCFVSKSEELLNNVALILSCMCCKYGANAPLMLLIYYDANL